MSTLLSRSGGNFSSFIFDISWFSKQRTQFHDNVVPILNDLSLPYSVSSFLGFDQRLKSKHFSKSQCSNRRRLYKTTCDFLQSTGRFKFVWFVLPPILHSWYFCIFHWVMYHFSLPSCIWDFVYIWLTLWILYFFYGYFFNPASQASLLFTYVYLGFCLRLTDFISISFLQYFFFKCIFFS